MNKSNIEYILKKISQYRGGLPPGMNEENTPPAPLAPGNTVSNRPPKDTMRRLPKQINKNKNNSKKAPKLQQVIKMQEAMPQRSDIVLRDTRHSEVFTKNKKDFTYAERDKNARGAFMDFFGENFIGNIDSKYRGVEWSADPNVKSLDAKRKGETGLYEMGVIMDTIKRIGSQSNEFEPDGNWEWRTHNALKNICGFALALLQLAGELEYSQNVFTLHAWRDFNNKLSSIKVDGQNVQLPVQKEIKYSNLFTSYIKQITELYEVVFRTFLVDSKVRPYIEGVKPFYSVDSPDKLSKNIDHVKKHRREYETDTSNFIVVQVDGKEMQVPIYALSHTAEYISWAHRQGYNKSRAQHLFNNFIKPSIDKLFKDNEGKMQESLSSSTEKGAGN